MGDTTCGDAQLDLGATARCTADLELPFHDGRALTHPGQPEAGRLLPLIPSAR